MRPKQVTATTGIMAILNVLGYAILLDAHARPRRAFVVEFLIVTAIIVAGYIVLWFYWRGRNWARWLVLATCLLCFWNLRGIKGANVLVQFMIVSEAAVAAFLLYWLNTAAARAFFRPLEAPQRTPAP